MAWRNVRSELGDRWGALRVSLFLMCNGMLSWLLLGSHEAAADELLCGLQHGLHLLVGRAVLCAPYLELSSIPQAFLYLRWRRG